MIIVQTIGGLGNQMFQYAAARALAEINQTEVKLDVSGFQNYQLRNFDLFHFAVNAKVATQDEIDEVKAINSIQRVHAFVTPYPNKKFYKQTYFHFDKRFFKLTSPVYIKGHFHSELFFSPVQNLIRREFTFKNPLSSSIINLGNQLNKSNTVSLHVRRGDYKSNAALKYHGILPLDYYKKAISIIEQQHPNTSIYIFSDDSAWVQKNLQLSNATIVSGNLSQTHFDDLYLMSQCQHNIIANSSYSWWGAWLGTQKNKTVIAPKKWFDKGPKDTHDLFPDGWITI